MLQHISNEYIKKLEGRITKLEKEYNKECPVCMEKINNNGYTKLKCGHIVDVNCFVNMCKNNLNLCPLCRDVIYIRDDESDSDEEIDTSTVERNLDGLLTFDYKTLEELHEEYNYAFDEISISALRTVLEEYMIGVEYDEESYRLEPPSAIDDPPQEMNEMTDLYPIPPSDVFLRLTNIEIFQVLERAAEGMNLESATQYYSPVYLYNEYNLKYPEQLLASDEFLDVLKYLVIGKALETNEDGFYRKINKDGNLSDQDIMEIKVYFMSIMRQSDIHWYSLEYFYEKYKTTQQQYELNIMDVRLILEYMVEENNLEKDGERYKRTR